jgi:hypothetical protein
MGRSFKLKPKSNIKNNNKNPVKEEKVVKYDHRPVIKTNPKILEEFKKNMSVPSELWDTPYENPFKNEYYKMYNFRPGCCVGKTSKCICEYPYES